jgi:protein-tyrosine-phosphatase
MTESPEKLALFVCTGNICRSPMAEYIGRQRLGSGSGWHTASAGLMAVPGIPASREAVSVLDEIGIDLTPHRSRPLTAELADEAGLLLVMTRMHAGELIHRFPDAQSKVHLLTEFGPSEETPDILDPIGQPAYVYRLIRNVIESAVADLVLALRNPESAEPRVAEDSP